MILGSALISFGISQLVSFFASSLAVCVFGLGFRNYCIGLSFLGLWYEGVVFQFVVELQIAFSKSTNEEDSLTGAGYLCFSIIFSSKFYLFSFVVHSNCIFLADIKHYSVQVCCLLFSESTLPSWWWTDQWQQDLYGTEFWAFQRLWGYWRWSERQGRRIRLLSTKHPHWSLCLAFT